MVVMISHPTHLLAALLPAALLLAAPVFAETAAPARPPNVVYFILDDIGYHELSCMGHPEMRTPRIDQLAKEGVRFTQMLAGAPVCAPTRCSLLTGKHAGHMTVRANLGSTAPQASIRADEQTLGSMFKAAGYATGGFGKWGIGVRGSTGVPEKHDFDIFFGYYDQTHAHTYYPRYLVNNSVEVPLDGNTGDPTTGKTFSQYRIVEETKKFIAANQDRPFFAYCAWTPPHGLWGMPENDPAWDLYKDKPWRTGQKTDKDSRIYAAMISMADRQIGEVLDQLKSLGIAENTIVVFSGDNGGQPYFNSKDQPNGIFSPNVDPHTGTKFRGGKGDLYEGGLRVPFIVAWPGNIVGGRVSTHLGYFPDMAPTLAELTGTKDLPGTDGVSIAPTLLGTPGQQEHDYLYWEHLGMTAVRFGDMKAVLPKGGKDQAARWALYDLSKDISETKDISAEHPDIVARAAAVAKREHEPVRPGVILDKELAGKDRQFEPKEK